MGVYRQIEKDLVSAIRGKRNWGGGNTIVTHDAGGTRCRVYLHGNLIAVIDYLTKTARLSSARWRTSTTKSRLNAIMTALNISGGIKQKNRVWYRYRNEYNKQHLEPFKDNMVLSFRL